jgi:hypothetical protein
MKRNLLISIVKKFGMSGIMDKLFELDINELEQIDNACDQKEALSIMKCIIENKNKIEEENIKELKLLNKDEKVIFYSSN